MGKKKLIVIALISLLSLCILSGCIYWLIIGKHNNWNAMGLSFEYPEYLKAVHQSFDHESDANIFVTAETSEDFITGCLNDEDDEYAKERNDNIRESFKSGIRAVKSEDDEEDLRILDNIGCGWVAGNMGYEFIDVGEYKGVILHKALTNAEASLSSFVTQLLIIDDFDNIYTITFNYNFGELDSYLLEHRYKDSWEVETTEEQSDEMLAYFSKGEPLTLPELKGFEENREVIMDIIETVELKEPQRLESLREPIEEFVPEEKVDPLSTPGGSDAFIIIPPSETLTRAENGAYNIVGLISRNCESITVHAQNPGQAIDDRYELKNYKPGDTTFKYGLREDWNNLGLGTNIYTFKALCDGENIEATTVFSFTRVVPQYNIPTTSYGDYPIGSPSRSYSSSSYNDGYEWAEDNDIDDFDDCQTEFGTGWAEDGCNEYVKENHVGFSTFHGYDCTEDCSGHEAGYEWAEENDIDDEYDCTGYSDSFIEGCEIYVEENY